MIFKVQELQSSVLRCGSWLFRSRQKFPAILSLRFSYYTLKFRFGGCSFASGNACLIGSFFDL